MNPSEKPPQLFRRQFLLSPDSDARVAGWHARSLRRYGKVFVHPDLPVTQRSTAALELTLLGFAVDPRNANSTDAEILEAMMMRAKSARDVLKLSAILGGRWVLIAIDPQSGLLFTDPMGLREVYYLIGAEPWCASQFRHIAQPLGLEIDSTIRDGFMSSNYAREHPEYFWPGDLTPYREIKHLTPNHFLDLDTMLPERFWPDNQLPARSLAQCVDEAAPLFEGLLRGAHHRFPLALPITAGFDSRTILAATRSFAKDVFHYTLRPHDMNSDHEDLEITGRLLRQLGLQHHQIRCPSATSRDFWTLYDESVSPAHTIASRLAEGLSQEYRPGHVSLSGHGSEIYRCFYYHGGNHPLAVDGTWLANKVGMRGVPGAEEVFGSWLKGAQSAADSSGIMILDLFYWENRVGRWAANGQAQWDIVHERFTPSNCRVLLECMLSADRLNRLAPHYRLNQRLIRALWPELLRIPFNPNSAPTQEWHRSYSSRARKLISNSLRRIGLLPAAKLVARSLRDVP